VSYADPSGFGGLSGLLAELRGERNFNGGVECFGDVCQPVAGGEVSGGYWWPRISITFVALAALLTLASMRLVVPAGMRWAFRRKTPRYAAAPGDPAPASPAIDEVEP
jgi:hypothetical protein